MKTISRIAYSNDKKNKTRSILIMMAICLTTILLAVSYTHLQGITVLRNCKLVIDGIKKAVLAENISEEVSKFQECYDD